VVGLYLVSIFLGIVVSFLWSEYLLAWFISRNRLRVTATNRLTAIFLANLASLDVLWVGGLAVTFCSGAPTYAEALLVGVLIQSIWILRHLWLFHRDHLRMSVDSRHSRIHL
jgi:hypothetical protein